MAAVDGGLSAGASIAGYRIDSRISRGGMGVVYLATHQRLGRKAALKILSPELADDASFRERFVRESELTASLEHPNIIPIYDAGEHDGVLYIAMRYVEGLDLTQQLERDGRLTLERTVAIIEPVAAALDRAHSRGLIHRDVKPANILIEQGTSHVYLTDFGIAKLSAAAGLTRTGAFLGTVHYCAPEQIEGKTVDARTDMYSLGCVLYHCLVGQPPYPRDTEAAVIHAHMTEPPPAVTTVRPELPRYLDGVVATAMAKFPEVRYAAGSDLISALRDGVGVRGAVTAEVAIQPIAGAAPTIAERSDREPLPPPTKALRTPPRRRRWLIGGGAGLALVIVGAAAAFAAFGNSSGHAHTSTPKSTSQSKPPKPLGGLIAARLESDIVPAQLNLTAAVRSLTRSSAGFQSMERSAAILKDRVLAAQGWSTSTLAAHDSSETAVKNLFDRALTAQADYAQYLEALPQMPSQFSRSAATGALDRADRAEAAYARLSGAVASVPEMPLHRRDHTHLFAVVAIPKPAAPTNQGSGQPTTAGSSQLLGRSVEGRPIRLYEVGDPAANTKILVFGCIHGNECAGTAVADLLVRSNVPAGIDLWVVPNLNPDGFTRGTRQNGNGVDLNRNFPWHWAASTPGTRNYSGTAQLSEPEAQIARDLIFRVRPDITIWLHTRDGAGRPALVDTAVGDLSIEQHYAQLVGYPTTRLPQYPGGVTSWQIATFPGTTPFVVELPFGKTLPLGIAQRHADAILTLGQSSAAQPPPPTVTTSAASGLGYDFIAYSSGEGVRYRYTPNRWCAGKPHTDPCWIDVVPGNGPAEGQRVRIYCYTTGYNVRGDTNWAKVGINPDLYVPASYLRNAHSGVPAGATTC